MPSCSLIAKVYGSSSGDDGHFSAKASNSIAP